MTDFTLDAEDNGAQISLATAQGPSYSQDHLDDLSTKYDSVMGPASPGIPSIQSALSTNNQDAMGDILATQKGIDLQNARSSIIQGIANKSGGNPTPQDVAVVNSLGSTDLASPNIKTILEQGYAKQVTNTQLDNVNSVTGGDYDKSIVASPSATNEILDRAEFATSRNMISNNIYKDLQQKFGSAGVLMQGQAWLQQMIPFRSWAAMDNFVSQSILPSSILPGDSVEQQVAYLHTLGPDEYKQRLQEGVDNLVSQGDYLDAMQFVEATLSYGDNDKNWANIFAGLDVASVLPAGTIIKALKGSSQAVNVAVKDAETMARVAGMADKSAAVTLAQSTSEGTLPLDMIHQGPDVERALTSIARPAEAFAGPTRADGAVLGRLQVAQVSRAQRAVEILAGANKVTRLTDSETAKVVNDTFTDMRRDFSDQSSNLINLRHDNPDNLSNINTVTAEFGKKDGGLFATKEAAQGWAARILGDKTTDYNVVNPPGEIGWRVEVSRNVDESRAGLRDFSIDTDSKPADTFSGRLMAKLNSSVPYLTGADTKLSESQQLARSAATMSQEKQFDLLAEFGRPIAELQKDKAGFKEWNSFLTKSRDRVDPERGKGMTYHTQGEFEDAWYTQFQKLPTEAQSNAFHSFKTAYDMEWGVRALDVYKQKAILGIEKFSAKRMINDSVSDPIEFEGKVVEGLPFGSKDSFRVGVLDGDGTLKAGLKSNSRFMNEKDIEALKKELNEGYTLVQAYDGLVKVGDKEFFNFLAMKNFKRDRISMDLSYKNGSRQVQKYPYYIKQGRFDISGGRAFYKGDVALANARDGEDGKIILDKMEQFRRLMKDQTASNKFRSSYPAKDYFEKNFPMWDYGDFAKSIQDGKIDLTVPFRLTRGGNRTVDDLKGLTDALRAEGHQVESVETNDAYRLSNQVRGRFLGDKDEKVMKTLSVEKDSIFELAHDSTLSPLETLKLSMGDMVDINTMNDYKIKSVRDYTQQFGHLLDGDQSDFANNGIKFIYNPLYSKAAKDASPSEVRLAEATRKAILSLWQHSSPIDRQIGIFKEKIVRSLRNSLGEHAADMANDKLLPAATNAPAFMRGFAFHTKMGMFNPKQLFMQSSGAVQIALISPKYGAKGAMLTVPIMMGLKAPTEDILRGVGVKLAKTMGISADDYVEMIHMYRKSGFDLVGGDISYINDMSAPNFTQGKFGQILDFGTTFFKTGERSVRSMAFAAAYLERKAALKAGVLSRNDEAWILKRAKDMTGNMTRDSNAPYQQGWSSVATQFFGYQMRLAEQMLGTKLSLAEKSRLMGGMSLMYGLPVGLGMTVGVVPVREWIKGWMAQDGVDTSNNPLLDGFVDGYAAEVLKMISGTKFDVAGRYGPNGINNFGDLMSGDTTFFQLMMGASGGTIFNTVKDFDPIIRGLVSAINPGDMQKWPVTAQDWLQPLSEITTANSVIKLWKAQNIGAWVSKNENILSDVTQTEAMISAILGVDPQRVSDAFTDISVMNTIKDTQKADQKEMIADGRRAIQALKSGDTNLAQQFFNRVKIRGISSGFTPDQVNTTWHYIMQDSPLDESVLIQFQKMMKDKNGNS